MYENLVYLIIFLIMSLFIGIFLIKYLKLRFSYFSNTEINQAVISNVKIPSENIELNAKLIIPKYILNDENAPVEKIPLIFINHGWSMNIDMKTFQAFGVAIALGGPYAVLIWDCRGFGKTPGKRRFSTESFDDIPNIISYGLTIKGIDQNKLGFIGMSFGGQIALSRAYSDKRIKAVISIVSPHNFKENFLSKPWSFSARVNRKILNLLGVKPKQISEESNRSVSPEFILDSNNSELNKRVFLIGTKNDAIINFKEFEQNRNALNLPESQILIFEKAGHTLFFQELVILGSILRFLKKQL